MAARARPRRTRGFPYDRRHDPPAPVLPVRVGRPGGEVAVALPALVDSGADITVLPEELVASLRLPQVGRVAVRGVGGLVQHLPVYAAEVEVAGLRRLVEVLGICREVLLGRDLLNRLIITLHGPREVLRIASGRRPVRWPD